MTFDPATILEAPFKLHGRDPATGVDCHYVVQEFHRQEGRHVFDPLEFGLRSTSVAEVIAKLPDEWEEVMPTFERGDVIVFRNQGTDVPHCGVYLGNHEVIHATRNLGVIVSKLRDIRHNIITGYRLKCHVLS